MQIEVIKVRLSDVENKTRKVPIVYEQRRAPIMLRIVAYKELTGHSLKHNSAPETELL